MIENERTQLLNHWRQRLRKNPDWISNKLRQVELVFKASRGDAAAIASLNSYLRQFHDKLGFKAKQSVKQGGLCAGAIFRTEKFIATSDRVGAKKEQVKTVHIEHTVPVNVLESEIQKQRFPDYPAALAWLLKHSVTTAFHQKEEEFVRSRARDTGALDSTSSEYMRPFMRYERLHSAEGIVWNVFDGVKIDPKQFTFCDHFEIVCRLLEAAEASPQMLSVLRSIASQLTH